MAEIDWDDEQHRRCVAAGLVRRVKDLEAGRIGAKGVSPTGHFRLLDALRECHSHRKRASLFGKICSCHFIYGAVNEYDPPEDTRRHPSAPRYIVAFRGTMIVKDPTAVHDLYLDGNVLLNTQHDRHRFSDARRRVWELLVKSSDVADAGHDVWLAGHSLGASIALDVGRDLAARRGRGYYLPTFPPQVSLAPGIGMLPDSAAALRKLAKEVVARSYLLKAALGTTVLRSLETDAEELFERMAPWVPELYVHERDLICKGFIDYFETRELVKDQCPSLARSAGTLAYRESATCWCNCSPSWGWGRARRSTRSSRTSCRPQGSGSTHNDGDDEPHDLLQWCQPELMLSSKLYSWPA